MKVRILGIGDVVGKPGRNVIKQQLMEFCRKELVDLVIANGENLSGGNGLLPNEADEIFQAGVHVITGGDHVWVPGLVVDQGEAAEIARTRQQGRGRCEGRHRRHRRHGCQAAQQGAPRHRAVEIYAVHSLSRTVERDLCHLLRTHFWPEYATK